MHDGRCLRSHLEPAEPVLGREGVCGPDADAIEPARRIVGFDAVRLDPEQGAVRFARGGTELNMGVIGKGYPLDRAGQSLRASGVRHRCCWPAAAACSQSAGTAGAGGLISCRLRGRADRSRSSCCGMLRSTRAEPESSFSSPPAAASGTSSILYRLARPRHSERHCRGAGCGTGGRALDGVLRRRARSRRTVLRVTRRSSR